MDITSRSLFHGGRGCGNHCRFHWYKMKWPFHIYGKRLRFVDPTKPQEISTADRFSLQYGEGCCGTSTHDNRGRSCADVYFIYDQRGCGLIDSGNKGLWSDVSCHEKKIALCEKARRQIYKHYVSVQARLDFDTADKYCAKYYGMSWFVPMLR